MTGDLRLDWGGYVQAAVDCTDRDTREEATWIAQAKAGDDAAYRWLLERYRTRVVRLAAHILRRDGDAEDVAQEAFLKAFGGIRAFRGTGRFAPWLFQIVVRLCIDKKRRTGWNAEVPEVLAPVSHSPSADDPETRLLVAALLDRLTPPLRAALVLREMEGLDYEEIAHILAVPVGTVRSRLHAARTQFRALWTAAQEDDHA